MRFGFAPRWPSLRLPNRRFLSGNPHLFRSFTTGGSGASTGGSSFLVPGATAATLVMLAVLHARRLYEDQKVEEMKEKDIELEFSSDVKASFLKFMPLRSISRFWGLLTSVEIPVLLRPIVYKSWARAFHANLDEASLPLEEYPSLRKFFIRNLKTGSRPIDTDPHCLVSPVDGTVLRFGELRGTHSMIEQVKGFSYSASSLLGSNTFLREASHEEVKDEYAEEKNSAHTSRTSWWRISFASPKLRDPAPLSGSRAKGVFYCVIYLGLGDYHRVHSPADWQIFRRRHFSGRLFPVNERAARTIRNLYVENERVVLEGRWKEGFMALAAVGATNVGSIELLIEPELKTNKPRNLLHSEPPEERQYEPVGTGIIQKKGEELAAFNMGSTVILVFQAPISKSPSVKGSNSEFEFSVRTGNRVRVGEAIGRWG